MLKNALKIVQRCAGPGATLDESHPDSDLARVSRTPTDPTACIADHVANMKPYQLGLTAAEISRKSGVPEAQIIRLASNENPFGMSPKARAAMIEAAQDISRYPDEYGFRVAIAEKHGVSPENVIVSGGSDELIHTIGRSFLGQGTSAVMSDYVYMAYVTVTDSSGAQRISVAAKDYGHDLDAMRRAIRPDTRVVWVVNPNNPTGTLLAPQALLGFIRTVPRHVAVVIDEAYVDYLPDHQKPDTVSWLKDHPNLVLTRTFSKIHGMAGLRIGYGLSSPQMIATLASVRQIYSCNAPGLAAARASLADTEFIEHCRTHNAQGLKQLTDGLHGMGLETLPAHGNFIAVRVPQTQAVYEAMLMKGIILRPLAQYHMPDYLRISVGAPEQNARVLAALNDAIDAVLDKRLFGTPAPRMQNA